jgi:geranylgeranyl diphosphate synthase type I
LEAGAVMAGADAHVRVRMRTAGRLLGIAFQLHDDWLGAWGEAAMTGKSGHSDLVRRKLTHPVVTAYEAARPHHRRELLELYRTRGPEEEPRIRQLLEELGGADLTAVAALALAAEAVEQIRECGLSPGRVKEFADVAEFLANRSC